MSVGKLGAEHLADAVSAMLGLGRRWKMTRDGIEGNSFMDDVPEWMHAVGIGGYAEQGWAAFLQPSGKRVAGGRWGYHLLLRPDGTFASDDPEDGSNRDIDAEIRAALTKEMGDE